MFGRNPGIRTLPRPLALCNGSGTVPMIPWNSSQHILTYVVLALSMSLNASTLPPLLKRAALAGFIVPGPWSHFLMLVSDAPMQDEILFPLSNDWQENEGHIGSMCRFFHRFSMGLCVER